MTSNSGPGARAWPYEAERPDGMRLGISFSGGGIRSATFSLGVYQRLAEAGIFQRARYLSAVSGGSYLAAGLAISRALCPSHLCDTQPEPWARGSREEAHLRSNLSYLAPGGTGRSWLFANLLYGLILNLTPLLLAAYVAGRLTGMVLGEAYPGLAVEPTVELRGAGWVAGAASALVIASAAVVGARRFRDKDRTRGDLGGSRAERVVMALLGAAGILVGFGVILPVIVHVLGRGVSTDLVHDLGLSGASWRVQRFSLGLAAVAVALLVGVIAVWLLRRRRAAALRGVLAALSGGAILLVPFVLSAETSAVHGLGLRRDWVSLVVAVLVMLMFAVLAHNRRYSMHLFYRERIQEAFASRRVEAGDSFAVRPVPYVTAIYLSKVAAMNASRPPFPELIVCAAVAARGADVPSKTRAASFTFEGHVSGNARLELQAPTPEIEAGDWVGGGDLTLPSMMAISGAAVSPLMGRFTLPAYRFLMAMLNIRLGVWMRNPRRPRGPRPADPVGPASRLWCYLKRGWLEPGALYVLREGLGLAGTGGRFIYVSDGGHGENLGLTELLRRRCSQVVVVDASGDPGLGDVGRAISVARAELGVEVQIDLGLTIPGETGFAAAPVAVGRVTYPDGEQSDIYYARSVLWPDAPMDLRLLANRERRFPNHPTANQFLSGELFDAYRALGWAVGEALVAAIHLPPPEFDETRPAGSRAASTDSMPVPDTR